MNVIDKRKEKDTVTHSIGDFFLNESGYVLHLCQVGYELVCLVSLHSANRVENPFKVTNILCITEKELAEMIDEPMQKVNVEIHITSNAE